MSEKTLLWFSASVYIRGINVHIGIVALCQDDTSEVSLFVSSLSHFGSHQRVIWEFTNWIFFRLNFKSCVLWKIILNFLQGSQTVGTGCM